VRYASVLRVRLVEKSAFRVAFPVNSDRAPGSPTSQFVFADTKRHLGLQVCRLHRRMGTYTTGLGVFLIISSLLSRMTATGYILRNIRLQLLLPLAARGHSMGTGKVNLLRCVRALFMFWIGPQLVHVPQRTAVGAIPHFHRPLRILIQCRIPSLA
jgi:hypothetical protein